MSKTTPINQLPLGQPPPQMFVTDQQRQMVNQAQQAQQTFQMPQTTTGTEVHEDESAVLEVLNQLNSNVQSATSMPPPPPMQQPQPQAPLADLWRDAYSVIPEQIPVQVEKTNSLPFMNNADLMTAAHVALAVVIVSFIPIDKIIGRYIAIDKIPYSGIILKALLAGVVVVVMQHFIK